MAVYTPNMSRALQGMKLRVSRIQNGGVRYRIDVRASVVALIDEEPRFMRSPYAMQGEPPQGFGTLLIDPANAMNAEFNEAVGQLRRAVATMYHSLPAEQQILGKNVEGVAAFDVRTYRDRVQLMIPTATRTVAAADGSDQHEFVADIPIESVVGAAGGKATSVRLNSGSKIGRGIKVRMELEASTLNVNLKDPTRLPFITLRVAGILILGRVKDTSAVFTTLAVQPGDLDGLDLAEEASEGAEGETRRVHDLGEATETEDEEEEEDDDDEEGIEEVKMPAPAPVQPPAKRVRRN